VATEPVGPVSDDALSGLDAASGRQKWKELVTGAATASYRIGLRPEVLI
jgi:hypothetical protein